MSDYTDLFRGSEDFAAVLLPDDHGRHEHYAIGDLFGPIAFFMYDDGWRYCPRPYTTADMYNLMSEADWEHLGDEIDIPYATIRRLLDQTRKTGRYTTIADLSATT